MNINRDTCEIQIINFRKFHPRVDYKSMPWVKIDAYIFDDKVWVRLPHLSILFWLYLLCLCARKNTDSVSFAVRIAAAEVGLKPVQVRLMIDRMEENQLLKVVSRTWAVGTQDAILDKVSKDKVSKDKSSSGVLTNRQTTDTIDSQPQKTPDKKSEKSESKTALTWESFSNAYRKRYGSDPVRNATTNSQMSNFVKRIGADEAPDVAAFFVTLEDQWYTQKCHSTGCLLHDAEKLRTMWKSGIRTTKVDAKTAHWREQSRLIDEGKI
jgi:hypothetical protein